MVEHQESLNAVQIRPYNPLLDYQDVIQNLKDGDHFLPELDTEEAFMKAVTKDGNAILVAVSAGKAIGNIFIVDNGWMRLLFHLAVRKEYRGQGIGKKLMETAETKLKERGVNQIAGFVVDSEEALKDAYGRMGYRRGAVYQVIFKSL